MQVLHDDDQRAEPLAGTVISIGAYDGVHRGHREVIRQVREIAAERGLQTAVVTFDRHPASVVRPESAPLLLTDLDQKLELLESTGVDYTLVVHFDEARSLEPAEDFVTEVLVGRLGARAVVVGDDFHFGHRRTGNVELLRAMGTDLGFDVRGLELVGLDGVPAADPRDRVSSTAIRVALTAGELDAANSMLGRAHEVRGVVGHGDERARELGFRTANVAVPEDICLPADGIYAGLVPAARRRGVAGCAVARPAPDVLRASGHLAARGPPARLRRRPLRRTRSRAVRPSTPRRAEVRLGRRPRGSDGPGL